MKDEIIEQMNELKQEVADTLKVYETDKQQIEYYSKEVLKSELRYMQAKISLSEFIIANRLNQNYE